MANYKPFGPVSEDEKKFWTGFMERYRRERNAGPVEDPPSQELAPASSQNTERDVITRPTSDHGIPQQASTSSKGACGSSQNTERGDAITRPTSAKGAKHGIPQQASTSLSGSKGVVKKPSGAHESPGSSQNADISTPQHNDDKWNEPSSSEGPSEAQLLHETMKKNKKKATDLKTDVVSSAAKQRSSDKSAEPEVSVSEEDAKRSQLVADVVSRCKMYREILGDSAHKFWETQPMESFSDIKSIFLEDGAIVVPSEVKQEPYSLPSLCEWIDCDLNSDSMCSDVAALYSNDFLKWALQPPNYHPTWNFGVRDKESKKLVAFIGGVPSRIRVKNADIDVASVKLFCVVTGLRSTQLATLMMKEMIRRVQSKNVWQGIFSSDVAVPTPVSTYQYWTRALNAKKLTDAGVWKPSGKEKTQRITDKLYSIASKVKTPGFRKMLPSDVTAVTELITEYLSKLTVAEHFSSEKKEEVKFAFSVYNISSSTPLVDLMSDVLTMAKKEECDMFLAPDIMENESFFETLKFESSPNINHFYMYNQRLKRGVKPAELGVMIL